MKYPNILVTGATAKTEHPVADQHFATATAKNPRDPVCASLVRGWRARRL